ncbi:MAG: murein biosynthesis integral membrane protein MurJ [Patescibacteria group bacterium]
MLNTLRRLWNGETEHVTTAAIIVSVASLVAQLTALVRERILASTFGAGDVLDVYYAAFKIPDFLYNLVILGALSAAFIPVFTEYLVTKEKKAAWELAGQVLSVIMIAMCIGCAAIFFAAPKIVPFIAPGFVGEKLRLTIMMTRIMIGSTFMLALSAVMGGILQSTRRFFVFSVAPVLYNIGIIFGALCFVPLVGPIGLGLGVVLGAVLHFLAQASVALRLGLRKIPWPSFKPEGVRRILKLMAPRTLGLAVTQINLTIILALASALTVGSVAVLNFAMNLESVPLSIFGIPFALAAFPAMSRAFGKKDEKEFLEVFGGAVRKVIFFIVPSAVGLIMLRAQAVRLVLGSGEFDWTATIRTADALAIFALSLPAQSITPLLSRAFYAMQKTWTPLWIGLISEATCVVFAFLLVRPYGLEGLISAYSIAAWVGMILSWIVLRAIRGQLGTRRVWISFLRTLTASFIMAGAIIPVRNFIGTIYPLKYVWQLSIQTIASILVGLVVFTLSMRLMKSPELSEFQRAFISKMFKRGPAVSEGAEAARGV